MPHCAHKLGANSASLLFGVEQVVNSGFSVPLQRKLLLGKAESDKVILVKIEI